MNSKNKKQITGFILSGLMLLALVNSGCFFLGILKLNIVKWLAFNACSVAIIVYLVCFVLFRITKKDYLLAIPLLPLYYYGTMGLFVMPWNEANLFAQITHIVITINVVWILFGFLNEHKFESLGRGLLVGILGFVPVIACIQSYAQLHMNELTQLLQSL
jgi:hypothetical protein